MTGGSVGAAMTPPEVATLDGLQQVVDRLAVRLGRSVAVDDVQGRLVAASRHFGEEDELRIYAVVHRVSDPRVMAHFSRAGIYRWTCPGRVPGDPQLGFKARVCCPVRYRDILFGHLFLIDDGITDDEVEVADVATAQIGRLLYRRLVLHEDEHRRSQLLVTQLLGPDPARRAAALDDARTAGLLATPDPACAIVLRPVAPQGGARVHPPSGDARPDPEERHTALSTAVDRCLRALPPRHSLAQVGPDDATVLLFGRPAAQADRVARELVDHLTDVGTPAVAGVGTARPGDELMTGVEEACRSALAAATLPHLGSVVPTDRLGVYGLLLRLPPAVLAESGCPEPLRRLLAADGAAGLVETLEAYLDEAGDVTRASARLCVHRSTLYYRLGRIEQLAGVDLRDGSQRLELHLGLRLLRVRDAG